MEIAGNITMIASILWVIWNIFSLRNAVVGGEVIFPASITSTLLFIIGIVTILIFHFSPLHLIWIFALSFPLGLIAIMTPIGERIGVGTLALLSLAGTDKEDEGRVEKNSVFQREANKEKNAKKRGFGK